MIRFEGVRKCFGSLTAVDHLDLEVPAGELFGFLGPNGAGKTTTIRMAVGMLRPTSGTIRIAGYDVYAQGEQARAILGYVPDQPYVYEKLSGREFLHFVADLYRVPRGEGRRRAEELLQIFDLQEHADQLVERYSHGMRQKLVIASVLIHEPQAIFLDEPTTALDPRSARLVKGILRALCDRGTAVFMTTHVLEIAERMCDRVAIIDRGRVVALGTVDELARLRGQDSLESTFLSLTGESPEAGWLSLFNHEGPAP
ncbi:MAG: ABC transporter ATP-binding protein [Chloroflexi bacterium]|nr:ABC transporter ATP-binding protein [Chloroflexota bacterium]